MIIFLDIDGVMVPAKSWKSPELLNDGFPAFSNKASQIMNTLISEDVSVILTSSHQSNYTISEWKDIFKRRGINVRNLQLLGNNFHKLSRNDEILNWFKANSPKDDFIIIDDDKSLNDLPVFLKENLILTSPFIGLTDDDLKNAKVINNYLDSI